MRTFPSVSKEIPRASESVRMVAVITCSPSLMNTSTLKIKWDDLLHTVFPALGFTPRFVELPWDPDSET